MARSDELSPESVVNAFHEHLLAAMASASASTARQRYDALRQPVEDAFHMSLTARQAAGRRAWRNSDKPQRAAITKAFEDWTTASYATQFKGTLTDVFEDIGTEPGPEGTGTVLVKTRFQSQGSTPVYFTYLMINRSGRWGIYDVLVKRGTTSISQLAKYISEFKQSARQGLPALTAILREKTHALLTE